MEIPAAPEMLDRIAALPAGRPVLDALAGAPGVYLVGGAVRDVLLGGRPVDLDLVVEGDATETAARLGDTIIVHDRFGTLTVTVDGFTYDIARARGERYPRPGALPEVFPADLAEDLRRRDFTVNAIAVALGGEQAGELRQAENALKDLEARRLRVLHDASFIDDPTRLLRLVRYSSRLVFGVHERTVELAREAVGNGALDTVSGPRIGSELRLLAREPDPIDALERARELRIDRAIHPAFGITDGEPGRLALELLPEGERRDRLALAIAGRSVPAAELSRLLDALAFDAADRDAIVAAATGAEGIAQRLRVARTPSEIAAAVYGATPEAVALAGALGADGPARAWLERLRHVKLEIDGRDLVSAGIPEGPAVGRALAAALAAKLDGTASGRREELAVALRAAAPTG